MPASSFAEDVRRGLTATPKFLLPHYFYDALGSALFSAICELPEYYVTRAEDEILRTKAAEIAAAFGSNVRIAEQFPGDSPYRQPVHTVYGGAHLFKADAAEKLGALALKALRGDFERVDRQADPSQRARAAWQAANA